MLRTDKSRSLHSLALVTGICFCTRVKFSSPLNIHWFIKSGLENHPKICFATKRNRLSGVLKNSYLKILQSPGVMFSSLQTELFQICSCLRNLHVAESGFQLELLNHFLHSSDSGGSIHGTCKNWTDSAVGRLARLTLYQKKPLTSTLQKLFMVLNFQSLHLIHQG